MTGWSAIVAFTTGGKTFAREKHKCSSWGKSEGTSAEVVSSNKL